MSSSHCMLWWWQYHSGTTATATSSGSTATKEKANALVVDNFVHHFNLRSSTMTKREAIQVLMSVVSHFEFQAKERTYKDGNRTKTYTPSENQVKFNLDQASKVNAVIDFLFDS